MPMLLRQRGMTYVLCCPILLLVTVVLTIDFMLISTDFMLAAGPQRFAFDMYFCMESQCQ